MESWLRPPERPTERRQRRLALAASLALHVLFVLFWMSTVVRPGGLGRGLIAAPAGDTTRVVLDMPYRRPAGVSNTARRNEPSRESVPARPAPEGATRPESPQGLSKTVGVRAHSKRRSPAADLAPPEGPSGASGRAAPSGADATGRAAPSDETGGHAGRIAPEYAQGKLWVRPLPLPPRELAQRLSGDPKALADSVVNRAIQAFLDSVAADPNARGAAMPSWTTQIAGKKFGIDQKYLYVAGLRIPAAVLALLPLPAGGTNYDRDKAWRQAMDLRTDLMQAAQRAENAAEFKRQIKEIRERKQQEEEFRRNQATAPEPSASPPAAPPANPPTP